MGSKLRKRRLELEAGSDFRGLLDSDMEERVAGGGF